MPKLASPKLRIVTTIAARRCHENCSRGSFHGGRAFRNRFPNRLRTRSSKLLADGAQILSIHARRAFRTLRRLRMLER